MHRAWTDALLMDKCIAHGQMHPHIRAKAPVASTHPSQLRINASTHTPMHPLIPRCICAWAIASTHPPMHQLVLMHPLTGSASHRTGHYIDPSANALTKNSKVPISKCIYPLLIHQKTHLYVKTMYQPQAHGCHHKRWSY
jgi:hypothetical protein